MAINVTIWNENVHEKVEPIVANIHPEGLHGTLKNLIACDDFAITTATLDMPEQGLPADVLNKTDVLIWWGHAAHGAVEDSLVERIYDRVNAGMGLIVLHSGHHSKIFRRMTGTTCNLKWREAGESCRIWTVIPTHPIARGIPESFKLEHEEMYGEPFVIPNPDEVVFMSWFQGGNVFRSGVTYYRGNGRIFYFQPGHETYRSYYDENVGKVISNAVRWAYNPNAFDTPCVWEKDSTEPFTVDEDLPGLTSHPKPVK